MRLPSPTLFLERQTYRRRRLIDLIKILPVIGLVLWLVPLLWPKQGQGQVSSADAIIYVFVIWFLLVIVGAVTAHAIKRPLDPGFEDTTGSDRDKRG